LVLLFDAISRCKRVSRPQQPALSNPELASMVTSFRQHETDLQVDSDELVDVEEVNLGKLCPALQVQLLSPAARCLCRPTSRKQQF
jgi:hypothetical protein